MKTKIFLILNFFILTSCTSLNEVGKVMTNQKIKTTDEFLVEKKDPLIIPPNAGELPEPNSNKIKQSRNPLKKILEEKNSDNSNNPKKIPLLKHLLLTKSGSEKKK